MKYISVTDDDTYQPLQKYKVDENAAKTGDYHIINQNEWLKVLGCQY